MNMLLLVGSIFAFSQPYSGEKLSRGLIGIPTEEGMYFSWRMTLEDAAGLQFDLYRSSGGGAEVKLNKEPIDRTSDFLDRTVDYTVDNRWTLKATTGEVATWTRLKGEKRNPYLSIPVCKPEDGEIAGESFTYTANDCSVGDLDGDGEYEIILKWSSSNSKRPPQRGFTGNTYLDAYKMDGRRLWRIDLGPNVRSGAATTNFLVFDFDGDGKAEVVMKTSDGTKDGKGKIIGDAKADYREPGITDGNSHGNTPRNQGRILTGNEYLTVFNGLTGEAMKTIDYVPARGKLTDWGDNRANRSDRFLACVAYLDGVHPSVVMCRGYYTRTVLAAFDWDGKNLKQHWVFDSNNPGCGDYAGQGNHNLRVGDVDGDGCDEIMYGSCAIDHDGKGLYSTRMGHGDAMHLTQFAPGLKGLQVWDCHENKKDGSTFRNAATGEVLFQVKSSIDVGRCMAADVDPRNPGVEMWSSDSKGVRNIKGEVIRPDLKSFSVNMAVWWDGDLLRELLDKNRITKYDWEDDVCRPLMIFDGTDSNNGTKSHPCLQGDIIGDWREEVLLRTEDNSALRLYVSRIPTEYRFHTFLEDPVYRISIATQNVAYNQPTQPGFYFGPDLKEGIFRGYEFKNE